MELKILKEESFEDGVLDIFVEANCNSSISVPYKQYGGTTKTGRFGIRKHYFHFRIYKARKLFSISFAKPFIKTDKKYTLLMLPNVMEDGRICFGPLKNKAFKSKELLINYYANKFWEIPFDPYDSFMLAGEESYDHEYCCEKCNGSYEKWERKVGGSPVEQLKKLLNKSNISTKALVEFTKENFDDDYSEYEELTIKNILDSSY
jgi:hypothetical protein